MHHMLNHNHIPREVYDVKIGFFPRQSQDFS